MTFTSPADKTGGSAFPHNEVQPFGSAGMSLLDYFAVQLMAADRLRELMRSEWRKGR